ncbi:hypothetical protein A2334_00310 [Candidatus Roizmanbacteria bacterium RIFOXYB2_FULL_38_10]|uniref:Glycosyltransferase RgtA/B/C/D-like domain-containing protein n=1 Tax=Candidatus Roizmanbacteria bacterium RIFOXYD1_FULL_38_12 TaxID=1802093 RepID=A0A1F7L2A9_9BACT|nr:MAG: hypothetical protein A3K47_05855 [Candidatus Roizmanbacteria bacterium RIFOXYA2_FULL_38_14]OGK64265.1 MAG: hypothetical protein A3K27_05855 [Candidatus Roizmanbacteria bacterium RIFOXYA1_FULL_37_12]OGK66111.1 MAG: hypothetical protein A3K38_05855 [Candidatus Roizmanbacteria bacterium RIFOXYB1_FULL_40_23]OGK67676.1 MAG: hypothetical protein A2334_00310 [Candidatus Roizmanbacteria bacterium RIFOXYB2_FULL_38_10]OGK70516.1 MAG: hypothetical protein A3K21_05860 [Candidatus Roizmanbacteria ba
MKKQNLHLLATVSLSIFLFIFLHIFYTGVVTTPTELDSVMYHIPIAKSYLNGRIFSSPSSPLMHRYFPGASEGILAFFMLLHIPLNLYNVLGILCLFLACFALGKRAGLGTDLSLLFATSFSSLNGIVRWANVQVVDIWMGVFYACLIFMFLKPEKKPGYFFKLGIVTGMIVGTKYSGPLFLSVLLLFYGKKLIEKLDIKRLIWFLIPFCICGLFWYIRNYLVKGNPVYPIALFSWPGVENWALETPVWKGAISYPLSMLSALISEYTGWGVLVILSPILVLYMRGISLIFITIALFNLMVYSLLPNGDAYLVHVSNLRYSYPVFILFILAVFEFAKQKKKEEILAVFAIGNMLFSLQFPYHPKLLFLYIPLLIMIWLFAKQNYIWVYNNKYYKFIYHMKNKLEKGGSSVIVLLLMIIAVVVVGAMILMKKGPEKKEGGLFVSGTVKQQDQNAASSTESTADQETDSEISTLEQDLDEIDKSLNDAPIDVMAE